MTTPAELEQLSRLLSGELSPEETARLEALLRSRPDLAQALEAFARLDVAAASLEVELPEQEVSRVVERVLGPRQRTSQRWRVTTAAGLVLGIVVSWLVLSRATGEPRLGSFEGVVLVNGLAPRAELPPEALLETARESTATLDFKGARLILGPQTRVLARRASTTPIELQAGVVYIDSPGEVMLRAPKVGVTVRGRAVLLAEPAEELARVTARLNFQSEHEEAQVRSRLRQVAVPVAVGAALLAGLTVFGGAAEVSPDEGAPASVVAPGTWQAAPEPVTPRAPDLEARLAAAELELATVRTERDSARRRIEALTAATPTDTSPLPPVRGSLVDSLGQPVGDATVTFVSGWRASEPVVSDAAGRFTVDGPPGPGVVYAHKNGRSVIVRDVEPGSNLSLKLAEPGTLRGVVTVGGQPLLGPFSIWTSPGGLSGHLPGAWGGLKTFSGPFELERPAGELWLHVVTQGEPSLAGHLLARVNSSHVTDVTIDLTPATSQVSGRVVDGTTGKVLKHCVVSLLSTDGSIEASYAPGTPEFSFGGRSAGERLVQVDCEGYEAERVKAVVDGNQPCELGDVKLRRNR